jgi:hypothetical protein
MVVSLMLFPLDADVPPYAADAAPVAHAGQRLGVAVKPLVYKEFSADHRDGSE